MRRALLLTAGLLAAACASKQRIAMTPVTAPSESAAAVATIAEFRPHPSERVTAFDVSRRGRPDLWKYSVVVGEGKERVIRKERDLNGDGRVDCWEAFDEEGNLVKQAYDLDFDGKPDLVISYEGGQLVKKEFAPGFDGRFQTFAYYENGKLVRKERSTKGDGKIDVWEYWENGELDRIGYDLEGGGQVTRWEKRKGSESTDQDDSSDKPQAAEKPGKAKTPTK
jgi:hypothetical protein